MPTISKWDPATETEVELLRADGMLTNNGTKGNPMLQADLFGDWREELVVRHADGDALRIYTTTDATEHRIPTLMHDSQYRQAVAWQNTAYNQPPHPSYFLGEGMGEPPVPSIAYVGAPEADATAPVIAGLPSGTVVADAPLQLARHRRRCRERHPFAVGDDRRRGGRGRCIRRPERARARRRGGGRRHGDQPRRTRLGGDEHPARRAR